jgi:hypothetical protein
LKKQAWIFLYTDGAPNLHALAASLKLRPERDPLELWGVAPEITAWGAPWKFLRGAVTLADALGPFDDAEAKHAAELVFAVPGWAVTPALFAIWEPGR